jgi:UDP-glucose 4-epimerase
MVVEQGGRRVLVTGVAGALAARLVARLEADDRVAYIAGVDVSEPARDLRRMEFVRADLRNPLVAKVVESTRVDTVVHLSIASNPGEVGGRTRMKELNVIGSMQLLAAAQKARAVRRVVVKSSTAVYGSHYADPAVFREDDTTGGHGAAAHGYTKDMLEVERYARDFTRRRDDAALTLLRFANFLGPGIDSPLTKYFALPVVPTVLGFDPRVQFCHTDDAVEVLHRSTMDDHPGTYNVAGPGILYLSQAIRLAGRPSVAVPQPFADGTAALLRRAGRVDFSPEQLQFLLYGRVGDITRLRESFGYEPAFSTREAFIDFIRTQAIAPLVEPATAQRWERQLHDVALRLSRCVPVSGGGPGGRQGGRP